MFHEITMVGYLGKDPTMRFTPDGTAVTNMSVAVSVGWGENKSTIWFGVSAWGKTAEACNEHLEKGSQVIVTGELQPDKETGNPRLFTRNDGSVGASFEVRASKVIFGTKPGGTSQAPKQPKNIPF